MELKDYDYKYLSEMSKEFSDICNEIITKHLADKQISHTTHMYADYFRRLEDVFYTLSRLFERYNTAFEFPIGLMLRTICADSINITYFSLLIANQTPTEEVEKQVGHFNSDQVRHFINDQKKNLQPKRVFYYSEEQFEKASEKYFDSLSRLYMYVVAKFKSMIGHVEFNYKGKPVILKNDDLVQLNDLILTQHELKSFKIIFVDNHDNKKWTSTTYMLDKIAVMPIVEQFRRTKAVPSMINDAFHLCTYFLQYSKYEHTGILSNEIEGISQSVKMNFMLYTIEKIMSTFSVSLILLDHVLQNEKARADFQGFSHKLYEERLKKLMKEYVEYVNKVDARDEELNPKPK